MNWHPHLVVFRLQSPLHIGAGKVGNVQRTYPYVTGRVLWGALTMRLTRNAMYSGTKLHENESYQSIGKEVHKKIAFTYFYTSIKRDDAYKIVWPWNEDSGLTSRANAAEFRSRFIRSYASTALEYPFQSAAESLLHESEFITPHTIEKESESVYLSGYFFVRDDCSLDWQSALKYLQFGGDRGYGWGRVSLAECKQCNQSLFGGIACFDGSGEQPIIALTQNSPHLLAHTKAENTLANGDIEPLVGRLWQASAGQNLEFSGICFRPGSTIAVDKASFSIGHYGVWYPITSPLSE